VPRSPAGAVGSCSVIGGLLRASSGVRRPVPARRAP
jgi:hypothetical protein